MAVRTMEPVTAIVTALATGAAAGLKPTAEKIIKDAYEGIKTLIKRKRDVPVVEVLEADPKSEAAKALVSEQLKKSGIAEDCEILKQSQTLLELIKKHAPLVPESIGVKFGDVDAASLTLGDIISSGSGVIVEKGKFSGDINITNVRAGVKETEPNPT